MSQWKETSSRVNRESGFGTVFLNNTLMSNTHGDDTKLEEDWASHWKNRMVLRKDEF